MSPSEYPRLERSFIGLFVYECLIVYICFLISGNMQQYTISNNSASNKNFKTFGPMYASGPAIRCTFESFRDIRCDIFKNWTGKIGNRIVYIQVRIISLKMNWANSIQHTANTQF